MKPLLRARAALLLLLLVAPFTFIAAPTFAGPALSDEPDTRTMVAVQRVEVIASPVGPVVVLKMRNKSIPVFVETLVAHSIEAAIAGETPARPLSHDLMHTILDALDAKVTRVVISLQDGVYRGELTVAVAGKAKVFDARSSDAIALAVRFKAPILLERALVESIGVEAPPSSKVDPI